MKTLHLFAGAGISALADAMGGFHKCTPAAFCEIDKDCRALLAKRFPGVPCFQDVRELTGDRVREAVGEIDVICGGSPCQDVSCAGKGLGFAEGARSSLIWHQVRLVRELRPRFMRWENVSGAITPKHRPQFDAFLYELEQLGYGGAWCVLSASQVGAPHQRKRVWLLAERGRQGGFREVSTKHMPAWPHPAAGFTWPTPDASVANYGESVATFEARRERIAAERKNGNGMGTPLTIAVQQGELWATARVSGAGTAEFVRDDGKLRDDLQTQVVMAECVESASAWPTPTRQDGENAAGPSQFRRNTLPLNAEVFRELVRNMTPEQVVSIIGDRRLNPRWVENLMGWPLGWTDLACDKVRMPVGSSGEYLFPAGRWMPQRSHEPPRITSVKPRSPEAKARNAALRMLGNGWCLQQSCAVFFLLHSALAAKPIVEILHHEREAVAA